jgi:hypothetical protein
MIASKKNAGILTICRANCVRTVSACICLLCFLSKNEINNGFGAICLGFLSFDYKGVANILLFGSF